MFKKNHEQVKIIRLEGSSYYDLDMRVQAFDCDRMKLHFFSSFASVFLKVPLAKVPEIISALQELYDGALEKEETKE
jgi:hypothetical protein